MRLQRFPLPTAPLSPPELRKAQIDLAVFDLQDQVRAQCGSRSSTTCGLKVPATGFAGGALAGVVLAFFPGLAPWAMFLGPLVGLAVGAACELVLQSRFSRHHQQVRGRKVQQIEELKLKLVDRSADRVIGL